MNISPDFTPILSTIGGVIIGISATLFLITTGKVSGMSGLTKNFNLSDKRDSLWRIFYLLGLIVGGLLIFKMAPEKTYFTTKLSTSKIIIAGVLVGVGTSLANGCTSGHGVCGISRKSIRSIVATISFMAAGLITTYLLPLFN